MYEIRFIYYGGTELKWFIPCDALGGIFYVTSNVDIEIENKGEQSFYWRMSNPFHFIIVLEICTQNGT